MTKGSVNRYRSEVKHTFHVEEFGGSRVYCSTCGTQILNKANFCHYCGEALHASIRSPVKFIAQTAPLVQFVEHKESRAGKDRFTTNLNSIILMDESHKEQTWADEYAAFKESLEAWGTLVIHKKRPLTASHLNGVHLLVVGGPENAWLVGRGADKWREEEVAAIQEFVLGGGGLLVFGDSMSAARNLSALTGPFGIQFTNERVGDVTLKRKAILPFEIVSGVREIRMGSLRGGGGIALKVEPPAYCVIKHEDTTVLAAARYGAGTVVAGSSLTAFAEPFLHEADNHMMLMGLLEVLLQGETSVKSDPNSNSGLTEKQVNPVITGEDGKPACDAGRAESLQALIDIWEQWETAYEAFLAEMEVVHRASFPEDREMMMNGCARNIQHWQPRLLDLMQEEVVQWQRIKATNGLDETEHRICQAIVVNRALAISQHRQKLEILKHQFEAMQAWDTFAVDDLYLDAEMVGNAQSVLQSEYTLLLHQLTERGLSLPENIIPEIAELVVGDWDLAMHLIDWLLPVEVPDHQEGSESWVAGWEEWIQSREAVELAGSENGINDDDFSWYFQAASEVKH